MLPTPTTTEWVAAALAAALVVALGALHVVGVGRRPLTRDRLALAGGWLLGCLAATSLLVLAVLVGTAVRASLVSTADIQAQRHLPAGPFVGHLFNRDLSTTERVGWISAAYLLPLAGTFAVLAVAVVDRHRSVGMRIAALATSLVLAVFAACVALGTSTPLDTDPGPLAGRVSTAVLLLSLAAAAVAAADVVRGDPSRR